jgi:ferredoxin
MPISVNKSLCIGCGACISLCPKVFKLDDGEGKSEVISQDDTECAKKAAEGCPVQAIIVS